MVEISEFFKQKSKRTLDELERELTVEEIQSIIYSLDSRIQKEPDGKIYFMHLGSDRTQEIARLRKEKGLKEDDILVTLVEGYLGEKPTYMFFSLAFIDEVPELSKYLRPSRD